jgi:hypothetical protein
VTFYENYRIDRNRQFGYTSMEHWGHIVEPGNFRAYNSSSILLVQKDAVIFLKYLK